MKGQRDPCYQWREQRFEVSSEVGRKHGLNERGYEKLSGKYPRLNVLVKLMEISQVNWSESGYALLLRVS